MLPVNESCSHRDSKRATHIENLYLAEKVFFQGLKIINIYRTKDKEIKIIF